MAIVLLYLKPRVASGGSVGVPIPWWSRAKGARWPLKQALDGIEGVSVVAS